MALKKLVDMLAENWKVIIVIGFGLAYIEVGVLILSDARDAGEISVATMLIVAGVTIQVLALCLARRGENGQKPIQ